MNESELKSKAVSGVIWKFGERILAQLVTFIVSLVIARILLPEDYGIIAIISVFINILNVFVTSGYGTALIQKKDADDNDFNAMFTFSGSLSIVIYLLLFFLAPLIAKFYEYDILVPIIRVMGLRLPIAAFNSIQQAYVAKKMEFKKFFWATLGGTVASAVVGITMAVLGFGVWALVGQYFSNIVIDTLILFIVFDWRYKPYYSHKRVVPMIKFGSRVLLATLIDSLYMEIRTLIIGKKYDVEDLAFYNRGEQFPKLVALNIATAVDGVLLPIYSKLQDNIDRLKNALKRSNQISTYIILPLMIGMAAVAEPMIRFLLTDKWIEAVPFVQIYCISYCFNVYQMSSTQVIKALGKSGLYLKLEIIKKVLLTIALIISFNYGVFAIAFTAIVINFVSMVINLFLIKKLLNYPVFYQIWDVVPQIILSVCMGFAVYFLKFAIQNTVLLLVSQVLCGAFIYLLFSHVFKIPAYKYILDIVKNKIGQLRKNRTCNNHQQFQQ